MRNHKTVGYSPAGGGAGLGGQGNASAAEIVSLFWLNGFSRRLNMWKLTCGVLSAALMVAPASANIIEFSSAVGSGVPVPITEDGITVTEVNGNPFFSELPGTISLDTDTAIVSFIQGAFDLKSLKFLANPQVFGFGAPKTLAISAFDSGNVLIRSDSISFTSPDTLNFTGWNNIGRLVIAGDAQSNLDNIVLTASSVPEPESWALMIVGMAAIGAGLRRRAV
jgi:PEP-CTERM motif